MMFAPPPSLHTVVSQSHKQKGRFVITAVVAVVCGGNVQSRSDQPSRRLAKEDAKMSPQVQKVAAWCCGFGHMTSLLRSSTSQPLAGADRTSCDAQLPRAPGRGQSLEHNGTGSYLMPMAIISVKAVAWGRRFPGCGAFLVV